MAGLTSGPEGYHVTLTTADGIEIPLLAVAPVKNGEPMPHEFEGTLTPVDATEQFRPGGIPREWADFSAGGGYTFYDARVPNGFNYSKNVWTLVPHVALPAGEVTEVALPSGTHGEIRAGFEVSGHLYFSTGRYACKIPNGTGAATAVADFSTVANMSTAVVITSVCLYLSNAYWGGYANSTAQPLVQHTLASDTFTSGATCARWHVASYFGVDGQGTYDQWMIGSFGTNAAVKYTNSASPLVDTNWTPNGSVGIKVGDPNFQINKIVTSRQAPFILKQEGAYILQRLGVYVPNITPHWADTFYQYNGAAGAIIAGKLYANILSGIDMVVGLDGQLNDTPFLVHPGADLPNESPVGGDCFSICRDGDKIVAAIYNAATTTSYICWGVPRASVPGQPGLTNFIWHMAPCVIPGERVTWMKKAAPGGNPRLWIATRNAADTTSHLYWMSLPRNGNILQELASGGPWRCRTDTCTLYLPSNPWSQGVHSEKAIRRVATVSEACSETSYLATYASIDKGDRAQLGENVTESPYVETRILDDLSGRQIAASVDFTAGSNTTPPILRAATLWAGEGIRSSTVYQGTFRLARGLTLRTGAKDDTTDPQAAWELLIAAQGPRPATITDWKGTVYTIALEQGADWKEREVKSADAWEIEFTMKFTVLAKETVYNDGSVYDSEATFAA